MKKSDLFLMALTNLKNRKTRTKLTVIGVIIGTISIVIMVSIGVGINDFATEQYSSDSTVNKITVNVPISEDDSVKKLPLNDSAINYINTIPGVKMIVPKLSLSGKATITRGKYNLQMCDIVGIDFDAMEKMGYKIKDGSFSNIDKSSILFGSQVVTNFVDQQGDNVKYSIDDNQEISNCEINPLKDTFFITPSLDGNDDISAVSSFAKKVRVSGIVKSDFSVDFGADYAIFVDMSMAKDLLNQYNKINNIKQTDSNFSELCVYVDGMQNVKTVSEEIKKAGLNCYSDLESLEETKKIMMVIEIVFGAIGAVSMFVAAFGISNTMVMSVYERTKEIGIMKVLGCNLKDIKAMFLFEAGLIGLLGGTIGTLISYILSFAANTVARLLLTSADSIGGASVKISSIPIWLAALGILFSVLVGVVSGISPAKRSVNVSALTAIHNE